MGALRPHYPHPLEVGVGPLGVCYTCSFFSLYTGHERYQTPHDLLAAIGRSSETKLKVETWDDLWRMRGEEMKQAGLAPSERRFVDLTHAPSEIITPPPKVYTLGSGKGSSRS